MMADGDREVSRRRTTESCVGHTLELGLYLEGNGEVQS